MQDLVARAIHARPELVATLWRRGMFSPEEKIELCRHSRGEHLRYLSLGSVQLATFLAAGDSRLAARAVLRNVLDSRELRWLDRLLRFPGGRKHRREDLFRIVDRGLGRRTRKMSTNIFEIPQSQPSVLINSVVKNLFSLAARAWAKRWIITFTGPTGVGKTSAVNYADRKLEFDRQVIRCKQITTRLSVLQALGLAPGEKWTTHGRNWMRASDLYERAVERIRQRPYLLMVDEADRLRMDCFELLRDLWDDARLPMLLVGNEILNEKINRQHERLFRRIYVRFAQPPLSEADLRKVLESMGYKISDDEFRLLWTLVGGSPGFAEAILENANEIAASNRMERGIEALEGAVRYFPTLKRVM